MMRHIEISDEQVTEFCQTHKIRRLALFGSVLREDFGPDSDIDVLVEFEPDARVGFFALAGIEMELSELLGRTVDLRTPEELSRYFREQVVEGSKDLYAA